MEPNPFLIQPGSLTLPGANSTVRSGAKTDYSAVNCSNSQKSNCPMNWSLNKSKPMSATRATSSRHLKNAATKSHNSRLNPKPLPSHTKTKIDPKKIASSGCVQRKNTSSTPSSSSLIGLKQPSRSLPARSSNDSTMLARWSDNSSAPRSTSFPTSKIRLSLC